MKRGLLWGSGGLLLLAVVILLAAWLLFRASLPALDGEIALAVEGPVNIERDRQGVPSIVADSEGDAAFAMGFVHAQERFFQMDTLRRSAAGELAALFGEVALDFDRQRRHWRGRHLAREALATLPEADQVLLSRYAAGVNAGLDALGSRPPEYWLLNARPQDWRAEDSLLVNLSMFFYLNDARGHRALQLDRITRTLPEAVSTFLLDPADPRDAPLQDEPLPELPAIPGEDQFQVRDFEDVNLDWRRLLGGELPLPGSNSWAVSGDLLEGEAALLAGDTHLGLSLPNTWYRLQFQVRGEHEWPITGASLPGVPGVVLGSNGHLAWTFTNSYGDWSTRVVLDWDEEEAGRYLTPDGPEQLIEHEEVIEVRGGASESLSYVWSRWGPVVSVADDEKHAKVWTAALPGGLNVAFRDVYRARDVTSLLEAGARLGMPPQNLLAVDRAGDIGWTIAGRIPERDGGFRSAARLPRSGDFHAGEWLSEAAYPRVVNPAHGRLWTANARVASGEHLDRIGDGGYPVAARQQQIRDRLFEMERHDEQAMLDLQLDDEARLLYDWVPIALSAADAAEASEARRRFREEITHWHGHAWPDSVGYRLLRDFRREVTGRTLGPLLHPMVEAWPDFDYRHQRKRERPVRQLLAERPMHLLAPDFDSWDELLVDAMDAVIAASRQNANSDGDWQDWGERNTTHVRHPMSTSLPLLARWLDLTPERLPGDQHMPRVQVGAFGASQRLVVRPGAEADGVFHMPGGQSGHFLSPWYRDGHRDWSDGRSSPFLPGDAAHTLILIPEF
ncbi:penicillin acylase family protein [Natronospira bacteriovora]|uniref:Penicillin acylase family protein n=1 Tax=Natronospira bacteriovora TaxID=3069753 RepID=A0ABU0W6A3_9GAMM|nr:penicillin acylase family protein [Natronospira sp. AB-CW4]MDQ2069549.1 penicillin acylase family protein [Natronospira sp. AB-CW4]